MLISSFILDTPTKLPSGDIAIFKFSSFVFSALTYLAYLASQTLMDLSAETDTNIWSEVGCQHRDSIWSECPLKS